MFTRILDISRELQDKSVLLLGPRMTGKSTLLRRALPQALSIDLLEAATFRALSANPSELEGRIALHLAQPEPVVVIDEIQKLPELLDICHRMLELHKQLRMVITGSSARKLRKGHANLLAGRLRGLQLKPITTAELGDFRYSRLIERGGLPSVLMAKQPKRDLKDYLGLYLQEEIAAEGLTRSIGNFSRFLDVAAQVNGEQVMWTAVASDAQVPVRTVKDYFSILEDTLLGQLLPPYRHTQTRKAVAAAKFYFFDVGVANALAGRFEIAPRTEAWGKSLEHLVCCELRAALHYLQADFQLSYWRTHSQHEVDFVLAELGSRGRAVIGIEVKGSQHVSDRDGKGLRALGEEVPNLRKIIVCEEPARRLLPSGIEVWPAQVFFEALWSRTFFP